MSQMINLSLYEYEFTFTTLPIAIFIGIVVLTIVVTVEVYEDIFKQKPGPVILVYEETKVVTKRNDVTVNANQNSSITSTYYATFQTGTGERIELSIPGNSYGLMAEGDIGKLTLIEGRYHEFQRKPEPVS